MSPDIKLIGIFSISLSLTIAVITLRLNMAAKYKDLEKSRKRRLKSEIKKCWDEANNENRATEDKVMMVIDAIRIKHREIFYEVSYTLFPSMIKLSLASVLICIITLFIELFGSHYSFSGTILASLIGFAVLIVGMVVILLYREMKYYYRIDAMINDTKTGGSGPHS